MSGPAPRITRRTMLGGAAAAGAGALLGPPAARAAGAAGRSLADNTSRPGSATWTAALAAIAAPARFALAGCSGGHRRTCADRAAHPDAQWVLEPVGAGLGDRPRLQPAAAQPDQQFGEPLWVRAADLIQLRSAGPVAGSAAALRRRIGALSAANLAAAAASLPLAQPILDAGPGQPPIIARSAWARGHAPPAGQAYYGSIKLAFVHHTDNPNGYSAGEVPSLLVAIFDYHRYVRRFSDIAYNFIVDAFGRIWEARRGRHRRAGDRRSRRGLQRRVDRGGDARNVHVGGADAGRHAGAAAAAGLEAGPARRSRPSGKVRVRVDPADAFYTPFRARRPVLLPRVAGHRDGDMTDCPGDALYAPPAGDPPGDRPVAGAPPR